MVSGDMQNRCARAYGDSGARRAEAPSQASKVVRHAALRLKRVLGRADKGTRQVDPAAVGECPGSDQLLDGGFSEDCEICGLASPDTLGECFGRREIRGDAYPGSRLEARYESA